MIGGMGGKRCSHSAAFPLQRDTEHLWKRRRVVNLMDISLWPKKTANAVPSCTHAREGGAGLVFAELEWSYYYHFTAEKRHLQERGRMEWIKWMCWRSEGSKANSLSVTLHTNTEKHKLTIHKMSKFTGRRCQSCKRQEAVSTLHMDRPNDRCTHYQSQSC